MAEETSTKAPRSSRLTRMGRRASSLGRHGSGLLRRGFGALASLAILLTTAAAVLLGLHVVFAILGANPDNAIVAFVRDIADTLAWKFRNLFLLDKKRENLEILINFGAAAAVYLAAGRVAAGLLRRVGAK